LFQKIARAGGAIEVDATTTATDARKQKYRLLFATVSSPRSNLTLPPSKRAPFDTFDRLFM
jgi:hypothetical protein